MKIISLRFNNLNSLYGEWSIDFTAPEYITDGIFALTGPTGSGKSTILDAICLALYGATPRLGKITSSNDIMSRGTGECFAEVTFESQAGTFRCHWSQHRARRKATGNLAASRHEISDAVTGQVIESKKSLTARVIEAKTGMDFQRFTRSMLLAQGSFDSFLRADTEDKSRILEQITGTGIYTRISLAVHERLREEKDALELLMAEVSGISILEPEEITALSTQQNNLRTKVEKQTEKVKESREIVNWHTTIVGLQKELKELESVASTLATDKTQFAPDRLRLSRGNQANQLETSYATLETLRRAQTSDSQQLTEQTLLRETHTTRLNMAEEVKTTAEKRLLSDKTALETKEPVLQKARVLDQKIESFNQQISREKVEIGADESRLKTHEKNRKAHAARAKKLHDELNRLIQYRADHAGDETLDAELLDLETRSSELVTHREELATRCETLKTGETELSSDANRLKELTERTETMRSALTTLKEQQSTVSRALETVLADRSLADYRREKDGLLRELAFQQRIMDLESQRRQLTDGTPCPLCGSEDHPYAEGNIPEISETDRQIEVVNQVIADVEKLESDLQKLIGQEARDVAAINTLEREQLSLQKEVESRQRFLVELRREIDESTRRIDQRTAAIGARVARYGISSEAVTTPKKMMVFLRKRRDSWLTCRDEIEQAENALMQIKNAIDQLDAQDAVITESMKERSTTVETLTAERETLQNQRIELLGDQVPDTVERELKSAVADAEKNAEKARTELEKARVKLAETQTLIATLEDRITKRTIDLEKAESLFLAQGAAIDIADETTFLAYRLPTEILGGLAAKERSLDERELKYNERLSDRTHRLETETARQLTDLDPETARDRLAALEVSLAELRDSMTRISQRLSDNAAALKRIQDKKAAIDAQKRERDRWQRLHTLIGSSDGKKYRNFAQGLTFELMIQHANRQLVKMSDRYVLVRDPDAPLELNVLDNYQGGEMRTIRNLSGGESFIVSLTLALGLSKMASRTVRVDSLFLDEGFGTLDEDALETALDTLARLHGDGKLIGVISHVAALRERIRTQIQVTPMTGGKSRLEGPGVQ